jgi:hypothetical protein
LGLDSIDFKSKRSRHVNFSTPFGDEDDYRNLEELVIGDSMLAL